MKPWPLLVALGACTGAHAGDWLLYRNDPATDGESGQQLVARIVGDKSRQECLRLARVLEDAATGSECARAILLATGSRRLTYWCEPA